MDKSIFLLAEDGLGTIQAEHFPVAKSWEEFKGRLETLIKEDHEFKSLIIDSVDWLEPLIWKYVCRKNKWANIDSPGYGRGFTAALDVWREYTDLLSVLREQKGMVICQIAHCIIKRHEDPETEAYDRYTIKLNQKASDLLQENSDCVLFMSYKKGTVKTQGKGGSNVKVVSGDRVIYTEERASHLAKNRYQLPYEMPFDWQKIRAEIASNAKPKEFGS